MREMECGKDEGTSSGFNSKESSADTVVGQVFVKKAPEEGSRRPSTLPSPNPSVLVEAIH